MSLGGTETPPKKYPLPVKREVQGVIIKEAESPICFWIGLLSPTDSGVQRKSDSSLGSGSGVKKIGLSLGLGFWSPKENRALPWTRTPKSKGKSGSSLDSDSEVRALKIGLWFGLQLLVRSGLGFGGQAPPPLSRHCAWERATSPTGQRSKGT